MRQKVGFNAGFRAYEQSKKVGKVSDSYGVGFVKGFHCAMTLDEMDKKMKALIDLMDKMRKEAEERTKSESLPGGVIYQDKKTIPPDMFNTVPDLGPQPSLPIHKPYPAEVPL